MMALLEAEKKTAERKALAANLCWHWKLCTVFLLFLFFFAGLGERFSSIEKYWTLAILESK